ncbi:MAG: dinitrogenase iron-molybdenum cofactor biosynthesis protein [Clostridiales bacterium]|jgi:predicted Fe-Mo cluster-binding NifX family protein|nr:dinitrogenase iron-molybdenum cofactor biosynthesis protein [Clostridiales bacterium]
MKLIIPVETRTLDASVCPSFGRTPFFALYDLETGGHEFLPNSAAESQGGAGIRAAQLIADSGAGAVVTCRCGENAAKVLNAADIKIFKAQDGSARENIEKFQKGTLAVLTHFHAGFHSGGAQS